jgi:hypothetical protein
MLWLDIPALEHSPDHADPTFYLLKDFRRRGYLGRGGAQPSGRGMPFATSTMGDAGGDRRQ